MKNLEMWIGILNLQGNPVPVQSDDDIETGGVYVIQQVMAVKVDYIIIMYIMVIVLL